MFPVPQKATGSIRMQRNVVIRLALVQGDKACGWNGFIATP